jgi:hypothetical protein
MANRALKLLPATLKIIPAKMAGKEYTVDDWKSDLSNMSNNKEELVQEILPLFVVTSQWVQVMFSQTTVTMSLVRLLMTRYDTENKKLLARAHGLQNEASFSERQLGGDLEEIQTAFRDAYDEYFPDEFYDFYA